MLPGPAHSCTSTAAAPLLLIHRTLYLPIRDTRAALHSYSPGARCLIVSWLPPLTRHAFPRHPPLAPQEVLPSPPRLIRFRGREALNATSSKRSASYGNIIGVLDFDVVFFFGDRSYTTRVCFLGTTRLLERACDGIRGSPGAGAVRDEEAGGSGRSAAGPPAGECYACTQPGVPAFHSTTCDQVHSPDWDADAGSSLVPVQAQPISSSSSAAAAHHAGAAARWLFGPVLDPRSKRVQRWNRWILMGRAAALAVDPLFFYALSVGRAGRPCMYMDAGLAAALTALRTFADVGHLGHVLLQFRLAYVSRESLVVGCGKLVWDARAIAAHYARSLKGLWFDLYVILPIPQVVFWLVIPKLIREEEVKLIMTILLLIFLFQFLPKVYHSIHIMRKMQKVTGYIFGTIWWGFGLNLFAYFAASHIAGGCCTFGNDLEPTSNGIEVIFSIINVLSGLMLFTLLIGNIQVFLHAVLARKRKMQLRFRDMEWWMRRRQLPSRLRQRVRKYERERWAAVTGDEEMEMIKDLPEGLRRDIKRYLCLELVKQVPLFHGMDDLILDNICDRLRPLVFSSGEKVIREGDPVQRMVFILQGKLRSTQPLTKGVVATCMLGAGNFLGDELLSWCLRRPFVDRLPASSATFECVEAAQAFCLDAPDLRFITEHFRYKFANDKLKRTARYYSSNWRTWAAVNIQLAWRRYRARTAVPLVGGPGDDDGDRRLRHYAAMFMSLRPHDHLE
ncbi:hypothetical protein PR202_ga13541 [Eleusine coracana subsp. coracana]|uniref:Cyclic nucleotide-binding domain-containing protein n=1 Tax=Eleusine coracana subsp. coracana TaxID=191504 RepID=A0AAV5CF02_ELECO|nr:hypothetical protein PR202_ga13541 [Eleusine coracana subsp. coracana]